VRAPFGGRGVDLRGDYTGAHKEEIVSAGVVY
jgi:hypothetical protein